MPHANLEKRRAYGREHYRKNKKIYVKRARVHRRKIAAKIRAFISVYLLSHPCIDCGENDSIVLEFDHRSPDQKDFNIGDAIRLSKSLSRVEKEISKCDIRCANCHRRKTFKERQH